MQKFKEKGLLHPSLEDNQQNELIPLMIRLTLKDPTSRPFSKDLYAQFEDEFYQDFLIKNQVEYKKAVKSLFKNRFQFLNEIEIETGEVKVPVTRELRDLQRRVGKFQERVRVFMGKWFVEEVRCSDQAWPEKLFTVFVCSFQKAVGTLKVEAVKVPVFEVFNSFSEEFSTK